MSCPALLRPVLSRIGDSELGLTRPALGADYYLTSLTSVMHREDSYGAQTRTGNTFRRPPGPPFLHFSAAPPRGTARVVGRRSVYVQRRPRNDNDPHIHTRPEPPGSPATCDFWTTTSQQHTHTVANCTPIPPRFTPHQKCWAVHVTQFSPKVAPHFRMTAQSGARCRFELSSGPTARGCPFTVTVHAHRTQVPSAAMHGHSPRPPRLMAPLAQLA